MLSLLGGFCEDVAYYCNNKGKCSFIANYVAGYETLIKRTIIQTIVEDVEDHVKSTYYANIESTFEDYIKSKC